MRRKIILAAILLGFISQGSAIEVSVGSECSGIEPLVSLNDTEGGHVGEPGSYGNEVCVDQAEELDIAQKCDSGDEILFTMENRTNSHISIFENTYNYKMCSKGLDAQIRDSCVNGAKVLSVTKNDNTHTAAPSYNADPYNMSLCLTGKKPKNVTIQIQGVSTPVYADGKEISVGEKVFPPTSFPYISSDQPLGIVSYGNFLKLSRPKTAAVSMTQSYGSFIIPFSRSGYAKIEGRKTLINDRKFLESFEPNFGFALIDNPLVKVIYNPNRTLKSSKADYSERGTIRVENKGLDRKENLIIEIE